MSRQQSTQDSLLNATIMMVDDELTTIEVLRTFLEDFGYSNFLSTTESVEAFDIINNKKPDIVLLDLVMPEVSGFEILQRIRNDDKLCFTPVIILTSSTDSATKLKALELGANDFLAKPVDPSELALRLQNTLSAKAYQDRLTYYDALTGLPNRVTFIDSLCMVQENAQKLDHQFALLRLNLDRFKQINETLGPTTGDDLLKAVASRLDQRIHTSPSIFNLGFEKFRPSLYRISGDEFSILLPRIDSGEDAMNVSRMILAAMHEAFSLDGNDLYITPSIGISIYPVDGREVDSLIKNAEVAMSYTKRQGGNNYYFYSSEINARSAERLKLANALRRAVENNELVLHYQPKVDVRTERIEGVEALLRWQHPEFGLVSPGKFIPIAEETGLIVPISEWVINEACRQAMQWQAEGYGVVPVAVNVASSHFRQKKLLQTVSDALTTSKLDPGCLELELTEGVILENAEENIATMNQLKEMGLKLALDDFGTGYSSLSYLTRFPIDTLKIDQAFIHDIQVNTANASIVTAIVVMAHSLGMKIVVEGVETEGQVVLLNGKNCDTYQGFYYYRPLPVQELNKILTLEQQSRKKVASKLTRSQQKVCID